MKAMSMAMEMDLVWYDPHIPVNWTQTSASQFTAYSTSFWSFMIRIRNTASGSLLIPPGYLAYLSAPTEGDLTGARVQTNTIINLVSVCQSMDLETFPFDRQICAIELVYADVYFDWINFKVGNSKLYYANETVSNGEWSVDNISIANSSHFLSNKTGVVYGFVITVSVTRNSYYYVLTLVIPTITLLGATAFTFVLPTDEGEKIILGATLLTALYVLLKQVTTLLPEESNEVPHLAVALEAGFILAAISLLEGVCVQTMRILAKDFFDAPTTFVSSDVLGTCGQISMPSAPWQTSSQTDYNKRHRKFGMFSAYLHDVAPEATSGTGPTGAKTGSVSELQSDDAILILNAILRVAASRLDKGTKKLEVKQREQASERKCRMAEYIVNLVTLVVYIIGVAYCFGALIYSPDPQHKSAPINH
jgi:hypothetical protein